MDAFDHVLGRYAKQAADDCALTACLIAWATNMGLGRMGDICDIGYHTLASTSDNFVRLETLREANDRVSNATAELPIFRHYNIGELLHSSSDGQKFETGIHTINARYSPKYFGLKKGVVSYSLVGAYSHISGQACSRARGEVGIRFNRFQRPALSYDRNSHTASALARHQKILGPFKRRLMTLRTVLSMAPLPIGSGMAMRLADAIRPWFLTKESRCVRIALLLRPRQRSRTAAMTCST
jgi:hypothetical protein